jgi:hypothetical protein
MSPPGLARGVERGAVPPGLLRSRSSVRTFQMAHRNDTLPTRKSKARKSMRCAVSTAKATRSDMVEGRVRGLRGGDGGR